jgi:hypothetical protein
MDLGDQYRQTTTSLPSYRYSRQAIHTSCIRRHPQPRPPLEGQNLSSGYNTKWDSCESCTTNAATTRPSLHPFYREPIGTGCKIHTNTHSPPIPYKRARSPENPYLSRHLKEGPSKGSLPGRQRSATTPTRTSPRRGPPGPPLAAQHHAGRQLHRPARRPHSGHKAR